MAVDVAGAFAAFPVALPNALPFPSWVLKNSIHVGSTEFGSC